MDFDSNHSLISLLGGVGALAWGIRVCEDDLKSAVKQFANGWRWLANIIFLVVVVGSMLGHFRYGDGPTTAVALYSFWGAIQIGLLAFALGIKKQG